MDIMVKVDRKDGGMTKLPTYTETSWACKRNKVYRWWGYSTKL